MAKGKNNNGSVKENSVVMPPVSSPALSSKGLPHLLLAAVITIITLVFLQACLDNTITAWDDTPYIKDNSLVKDLSWEGLRHIFSSPSMGNYHPMTILSYAIEYSYAELEPWLYHFDNLLLHVLCTLLVYWLVFLLSGKRIAALITALLFGLHPMHVESVAWAAARKDVLYGAFYLGAAVSYIYYLRAAGGRKGAWYAGVLMLFILALLSKPVAVTLPLTLLLIDYIENREWGKRVFIEKLPHFVLALVFGIIAIKVQHAAGAMAMQKVSYNSLERIALGGYALITYLWKAIVPVHLRCLYHYPAKMGGSIAFVYYLYPVLAAALIFIVWKFWRKNRIVVFGLLFFIANIALLLQFLQVGEAIVAERYTYIPYIGLFFIGGWYAAKYFEETRTNMRYVVLASIGFLIGCYSVASMARCKVWYDDMTLWNDEIAKEPAQSEQAYNNLAYIYYTKWMQASGPEEGKLYYDSATYLFNKAIAVNPKFANPYMGRANLERNSGNTNAAKQTYLEGMKQNPEENNLYTGMAILHIVIHSNDTAGYYFRLAMQMKESAEAYGNYANYLEMSNKDDSAMALYNKAVTLTKENYVPYMNRGKLYKKHDHWPEALGDFEKAMKIKPEEGELYYLRSLCDTQKNDYAKAYEDAEKAISLGYKKVENDYYNLLKQKAIH